MSNHEINPFLKNAIESNHPAFLNFTPLPHQLQVEAKRLTMSTPDLLRDTATRMNIATEKLPKFDAQTGLSLTSESAQLAGLLRKNGIYIGNHTDTYRVMTAEQSYLLATLSRRETPKQNIMDQLQKIGRPPIYQENAFIECNEDGKLYRSRTRGKADKLLASYKVAELVGSNQATIRSSTMIEGQKVVLEEYLLGSRESTKEDIDTLTEDDASAFVAHALITEDLDWQGRNFVVDHQNKLVRVDSKQVFVEPGDDQNIDANSSDGVQEIIKAKLRSEPVMQAILQKANKEKINELIKSFDVSHFKTNLIAAGIDTAEAEKLTRMAQENIQKSSDRLTEYNQILQSH